MGIRERMEKIINKGIASSKEAIEKAKDKTKELGEKGVLKLKIMKLENQAEEQFAKLGAKVYEFLVEQGQHSVTKDTYRIKTLLREITDIEKEIDKNEELMKKL
jgi:hypothetical protein